MNIIDYPITPSEIKAFENYLQLLQDDQYYSQELRVGKEEDKIYILEIARKLLQFHKNILGPLNEVLRFEGKTYNIDYLIESADHNYGLKTVLKERNDLMLFLLELYNKKLQLNPRHDVLNKSLLEMTGYDLQKLIMYILEDIRIKPQKY